MDKFESILKQWEANRSALDAQDKAAADKGQLVGRIIQHPYADGYAIYQIVKENAKTVRIQVCRNLGDDWTLPAWGERCSIPKHVAEQFIRRADGLRRLFSQK